MRGRRLWLKVETPIGTIPVFVVKVLQDEGQDIFGMFDAERPEILIRQIDNRQSMKQTLHHELMHVACSCHSGDTRERVFEGGDWEGRFKREEAVVSFIEPQQFDILVRNGFLKYPNPPKVA